MKSLSAEFSNLEISDEAMIGFDADGHVLFASNSAAKALGYSKPDDLRGVALASLIGDSTAVQLIDHVVAIEERTNFSVDDPMASPGGAANPVTFTRQDGSHVSLEAVVTPETSGGWITLLDPAIGEIDVPGAGSMSPDVDVASILRRLAEQSGHAAGVTGTAARFAAELSEATGVDALTIARSSAIAGIYEPLARVTRYGSPGLTESVDLPPSLVPQQGAAPVVASSLDELALFEPVIVYGEEFGGAYVAARAELQDGAHLLVIATAAGGRAWPDSTVLLIEAGALTLAGTLRAADLDRRVANYSRTAETVRQIGMLAAQDHDGVFLDTARKVIGRRLPISAISIHVADAVTGRCYVPEASSAGNEEYGALAPGGEWPLAGSVEQRVIKTGVPVFISASSPERVNVPSATIAHWRASGLQAVAAIPLREAGQVVAVMLAGFSSPASDSKEVIRLLESIAPAVHLGVGLSAARPGVVPESDEVDEDPGFVSPKLLLALARDAAESPDSATLFASVTEWMTEVIPAAQVKWGVVDRVAGEYRRVFSYVANSAATTDVVHVPLSSEQVADVGSDGIGLPEPGMGDGPGGGMRAAVPAGNQTFGIVTAWPHEGVVFETADLARLQRICEFVSGPFTRITELESARRSNSKRDLITQIGTLASEFHEPAAALRALKSRLEEVLPHDKALFVEFERYSIDAVVRYDSDAAPDSHGVQTVPMDSLPAVDMMLADEPFSISLSDDLPGGQADPHPCFAGYISMVGVPVRAIDGSNNTLLLLSEHERAFTSEDASLASALSSHLKGAVAGWQAYRATRESRLDVTRISKQLSMVLDSTPVVMVTTDAEGVCRKVEGHGLEIIGLKREEMLERSVFEWTSRLPQLEDAIRQALRGVFANARISIGAHAAEVWAHPVTEIDGSISGATLVGYDITESIRSKRAQVEKRDLQATLKERSDIVERVSHELGNQLQSIILYADVLADSSEGQLTAPQARALSVIQRTAAKQEKMIDDLLSLDYEITLSQVDVSNLMQEIVDAQEPIFAAAGQTLSLHLPDSRYAVKADHLRLTQVITNLLSNACKYSPKGAVVSIEVTVSGGDLSICVADTGPGIPDDQLERVWDIGIRLTNSRTSAIKGSGFGLAIARKMIEMHGGTTSIESQVGSGTRVTVTLPGAKPVIETEPEAAEQVQPVIEAVGGDRQTRAKRTSSRSKRGRQSS